MNLGTGGTVRLKIEEGGLDRLRLWVEVLKIGSSSHDHCLRSNMLMEVSRSSLDIGGENAKESSLIFGDSALWLI